MAPRGLYQRGLSQAERWTLHRSELVRATAELINDPTIQMLNKGRGAGFRLTVATQTLADFIVRLGSLPKARQVLGNINNITSLRVTDMNETQKYIIEGLPKVKVRSMQTSYRHEVVREPHHERNMTF